MKPKRAAFKASRLTSTAFVIVEHSDIYDEHPFIYAKIVPKANTVLLIDTGCGGKANDTEVELRDLREFIETAEVDDNDGRPLNVGGKMGYIVVLTHCHYDHILGVEQFAKDSTILASGHSPEFLSPSNLPTHSLCEALGIETPKYTPALVPHLHDIRANDQSLDIQVLHTPGHTPDEVALWDHEEKMLYVGDTLYEHEHIIFPKEGSIVTWMGTLDVLIDLTSDYSEAQIACGHVTAGEPARIVLSGAKEFMMDVLSGRERVKTRFEKRGEVTVEYVQERGPFSLVCPERLVLEAREEGLM